MRSRQCRGEPIPSILAPSDDVAITKRAESPGRADHAAGYYLGAQDNNALAMAQAGQERRSSRRTAGSIRSTSEDRRMMRAPVETATGRGDQPRRDRSESPVLAGLLLPGARRKRYEPRSRDYDDVGYW